MASSVLQIQFMANGKLPHLNITSDTSKTGYSSNRQISKSIRIQAEDTFSSDFDLLIVLRQGGINRFKHAVSFALSPQI